MKHPHEILSGFSLSFDQGIAQELGIEAAVVFNHIVYWLRMNASKPNAQMVDGKFWMYETQSNMSDFFGCMDVQSVKKSIKKLLDAGLIIKEKFSKNPFDQTSSYTVFDQSLIIFKKSLRKYKIDTIEGMKNIPSESIKSIPSNTTEEKIKNIQSNNTPLPLSEISEKESCFAEPAIAGEGEILSSSQKKVLKKADFSEEVRSLTKLLVDALIKANPDWRQPSDLSAFLTQVNLLLTKDKHSAERILQVLEWALKDEEFWSSAIYTKNPIQTLRKNFGKLAKKRDTKPKQKERAFAPCSDHQKAVDTLAKMKVVR